MHGQFYSHPHFLQRPTVSQNSASTTGGVPVVTGLGQQASLRFSRQHAGLMNEQTYQAQQVHQQRIQHRAGLPSQHYAQLLHNRQQAMAYNQALQQQNQNLQANRQQHELLQQQAQNDQSLRALLASRPYQTELSRLQMVSLDQLGLSQSSVSPHHLGTTNLHQHADHLPQTAAAQKTLNMPHFQEERRLSNDQRICQLDTPTISRVHSHSVVTSGTRNMLMQTSAPQGLNQEILQRQVPPTVQRRSPPVYSHNPNLIQNMLIPPQTNVRLISPLGSAFSPLMGQITSMGGNRLQQTSNQMARGEMNSAVDHNTSALQQKGNFGTNMQNRSVSHDLHSPRQTTPTGVTNTNIQVKRQTPSVNSCSAPIIIMDSDSDGDEPTTLAQGIESTTTKKGTEEPRSNFARVVIDDDIEITGFKEAEIMSHMRPDCPIHMFQRVDIVAPNPRGQNAMKCSKCYCYVCDKLANECTFWSSSVHPHCNAHAKASCWKARRNTKKSPLMTKLSAEEISPEMAKAGELAMQYMIQIREAYITYRNGIPCDYSKVPCNCMCHRQHGGQEPCMNCKVIHDAKKKFNYAPVRETALNIIREIESGHSGNHPTTPLIMLEAVLAELCSQRPADFNLSTRMPSNPDVRCQCNFPNIVEEYIEKDLMDILTRHEVEIEFLRSLQTCVEEAIKPLQLKDIMKKFLNMRHWDNLLLRAVLTGSNIAGSKGREVLKETADVIKMRVEKLDGDERYQGIIRYLKAVKILQSPKSTVSYNEIMTLMKQWHLLYPAKLGQFKDVIMRLLEPVPLEHNMRAITNLTTLDPDFLIQLLDALVGKYAHRITKLESFDSSSSKMQHVIAGKDADALLLVFQYILLQNRRAVSHIPLYLWVARWVNRTRLSPCLDPAQLKPWIMQSTKILEMSTQFPYMEQHQLQSYLVNCTVHDPHVHIFVASMNITNVVGKFANLIKTEHLQEIMEAYENNEWALFLLMTQSPMMSFRDLDAFRWITKFCNENNGSLAQIKGRVIIESVQPYPLADVSEFLKSLIKPGWTNSVESILQTVLGAASEYALRLFSERTRCDQNILLPKAKWLEDRILKNFEERISPNLVHREPAVRNYLKNIAKTCSYLHPVRHNIEIFRKVSFLAEKEEWPRRCNELIRFLVEKLGKDRSCGTMEEFSTLLWLLWMADDLEQMGSYITWFVDRHSCGGDGSRVKSAKTVEEVATLLDSVISPELEIRKHHLVMKCKKLFVLETLSWMTCTDCATKMSSGWTKIWIATSTSKLGECLHQLNRETLDQFKSWLNKISLDNEENYKRLILCLRSFLHTLIVTWYRCSFSFDDIKRFLEGVAGSVVNPNFSRDLISISKELINAEVEKVAPKKTEDLPMLGSAPVLQSSNSNHPGPSPPFGKEQTKTSTNHQQIPPATSQPSASRKLTAHRESLDRNREPETGQISADSSDSVSAVSIRLPQQKSVSEVERDAVMSPNALFKKRVHEKIVAPRQSIEENELKVPAPQQKDANALLSSSNFPRTKICENCGETISCASFQCPKCNRLSRQLQTVTCPSCKQENRDVKGYACRYCYNSLYDVLFGGVERSQVPEESKDADAASVIPPTRRKKKKNSEKRKKIVKDDERLTMSTTTITTIPIAAEDAHPTPLSKATTLRKTSASDTKLSPLRLNSPTKQFGSTLEDTSGSSSDDFVTQKPARKRKANFSNSKVPPIKLKRKSPFSQPAPKPLPAASLTDSDSNADDEKTALITSSEEYSNLTNKSTQKLLKSLPRTSMEHIVSKLGSFSPHRLIQERSGATKPQSLQTRLHNSSSPDSKLSDGAVSSVKPVVSKHLSISSTHSTPPIKKGVGHSSVMSKKQKNILSRLKRPGMGMQKFTPVAKNATSRPSNKDLLSSPAGKRYSLDNGNLSSPGKSQKRDRQRHDSSCSNSSVGSGSGLSFGLAKVKPRNVGHRSGGPPGQRVGMDHLPSQDISLFSTEEYSRSAFPQALNHNGNKHHTGKTKKKKKKELLVGMPSLTTKQELERKLSILLRRRKPGPANRSNYRKILRIEHKLRKLQRPNRAWRLPSSVKIPNGADLSRFVKVSLSPYPRDKLRKIQSLIPFCRLESLYA